MREQISHSSYERKANMTQHCLRQDLTQLDAVECRLLNAVVYSIIIYFRPSSTYPDL